MAPPPAAPSKLHPPLLLFPARNSNAFTGVREQRGGRGEREDSRSLLLLTHAMQKKKVPQEENSYTCTHMLLLQITS